MGEAEENGGEQKERRFSQRQYDMLKRCSEKKDMTEWNEWRKDNPDGEILLQDVELGLAVLKGVHLDNADLEGAHLSHANLEGSDLYRAHLERSVLNGANLKGVDLRGAHLKGAKLERANLEGANLEGAKMQNVVLWEAKLQRANLRETCLQWAKLMRAHLQGAEFGGAKLQGADFSRAIVDGGTLIWRCEFDKKTKFEGVALGNMRIYPKEKQLFEYNIRRMNWEEWYKWKDWDKSQPKEKRNKASQVLRWPVQAFWAMSDYGQSTGRIIVTFFALAFIFANIYYHWGRLNPPGIVSNLLVDREGMAVPYWLVPLRTLYFSIVTQTTLGFGDMYAKGQSIFGHLLLMLQVLLGYVLLGALITRFAVLFTAGGPAGEFAEEKKKTPK